MPSIKSALPILAAVLALNLPAAAQTAPAPAPLSRDAGHLVLDALEHRFAVPVPSWLEAASDLEGMNESAAIRFTEQGNQAHLEIYPRGESEAFWTTLYGARISRQPNPVLTDFRSVVIEVYAQACRPDAMALFQLEPDNGDDIPPLGMVCGAYLDRPGYAGKGEVMVMGFYKSQNGMAMVYQEWRGQAFDPSDPASWPVTPQVVEQRVAQFKSEAAFTLAD